MFKTALFGKNIEPNCEYCKHGELSLDKTMVLCTKRGIVAPYYNCKKFIYDPLKRTPKRRRPLPEYHQSDFEL